MNNYRTTFSVSLIAVIFSLSFAGCAAMLEDQALVTPLANNQYNIFVSGSYVKFDIVSERADLMNKWKEAASKACNGGKYVITKELTSGQDARRQSPTLEGTITFQ